MAKKRHPRRAPEVRTPATSTSPSRAVVPAPRPSDSWWFEFSIDRHHLALLRVLLFGVLAIDAFFQIAHAPRYGAGGFNVPQIAWLPLPAPSRELMLGIDLGLTYLLVLAALGVATRVVVPLAAVLDAYYYFSSQLDSYQHHYLVVLLMVCASFVPWEDRSPRVRSWALRLFTVQIAILYLWAAFAKLDGRWLDGTALDQQLAPAWIRDLVAGVPGHAATLAKLILVGEIALGIAWLWRRSWPYALGLGLAFHLGVELAGFQIGQFSYVMFAIYALMIPERFAAVPGRWIERLTARRPRGHAVGVVLLAAALAAGGAAWMMLPVPLSAWVVLGSSVIAIGAYVAWPTPAVGTAHLTAWAVILGLCLVTAQPLDYFKYWAGSARRFGQTEEMRTAYLGLLDIDPAHGPANYYLGELAMTEGELDLAIARFQRAQRAQPEAARGWIGEATVRIKRQDLAGARAALDHALALEPDNVEAAKLRASMESP